MSGIDWYEVAGRPGFGVGIDDREVDSHLLTPASVKERYALALPNVRTAAWRDHASGTAGVISDHGEITWSLRHGQVVALAMVRPGKGSGWTQLELRTPEEKPISLAFSRRFTPEYSTWITALAEAVARVTGLELILEDGGCDA